MMRLLMVGITMVSSVFGKTIWVEGEDAAERTVNKHGWYSGVNRTLLSGHEMVSHWGDEEGRVVYRFRVADTGKYALWLRANPVQATLKVKVGSGPWLSPDLKEKSHEQINIAEDRKPDLRFVSWVRAGVVDFEKGEGVMEVRFTSENHHHGMLDCFCLTTELDWKPRGLLKPGQKATQWALPDVSGKNLDRWIEFIRPSQEELGWRAVRWHRSLSEAAAEAKKLGRPVLLWAMNGHPCGET